VITIDKTTYQAKSFNERVRFLVLHYTERNLEESIALLTGDKVSIHYLVSDTAPEHIFQLVAESERAWHAGNSKWQGRNNINDSSIGIEIVNLGFTYDSAGNVTWHPYPPEQIDVVISLSQNIISRYNIDPTCIVAHSDISPGRKIDPGPLFPWKQLYQKNIGAWYANKDVEFFYPLIDLSNILAIQQKFQKYGYNIELTGVLDEQTKNVIISFQLHFRPNNFSGLVDIETIAILEALLKKYNRVT